MIQRIQSLWLFLAALLNAGILCFDLYRANIMQAGVASVQHIRANDHYPLFIIAILTVIGPLISIFMFGNRKKQRRMTVFSLVATISFVAAALTRVNSDIVALVPAPIDGSYWVASVLPIVSLFMLVLALRGIGKDDKLVKSLDRLR
jgi:hypothetical protein